VFPDFVGHIDLLFQVAGESREEAYPSIQGAVLEILLPLRAVVEVSSFVAASKNEDTRSNGRPWVRATFPLE
jgi:hypothetical protein